MKVGIIANPHKSGAKSAIKALCSALSREKVSYVLETHTAEIINQTNGIRASSFPETCDLVAVLGGDGTMLNAVNRIGAADIPVAGINIGTLGFLTTCKDDEIDFFVQELVNKRYKVTNRTLLRATILSTTGETKSYRALNEITLTRGQTGRLISLNATVDGDLLNCYHADGLIVATATGSTAYSLSAGGPLIAPQAKVFVLTPICPHSLSNRSLVVSKNSIVELTSAEGKEGPILFTVDGREVVQLKPTDTIRVELADHSLPLLNLENRNFYSTLRQKLGWG